MKKLCSFLTLVFFSVSLVFAANYQTVYSVDDPIIDQIDSLYILAGLARPSSSGPYSGTELMEMLDHVSRHVLDETASELLVSLKNRLDADATRGNTTIHAGFHAEASVHTNTTEAFQTKDNWYRNYNLSKPMGYVDFEHQIRESFYGFFEFSAGVSKHLHDTTEFGKDVVSTNLLFVGPNNMSQFDFNFPHRAFIAAGGEGWSVQLGRDNLSWGLGKSGNLILGDHLQYHNALHFTTWGNTFKYTYVISAFAHPSEYYRYIENHPELSGMYINGVSSNQYNDDGTENSSWQDHPGQANVLKGISCFIAHRLEWRVLKDRLGLVVNEGILYMDEENKIDIMSFAPAFLYHNNYTRAQSNSILGFEADYAVLPGLNAYAAFVVDDFNLPGEAAPGDYVDGTKNLAEQTAFGMMLGARYVTPFKDGILTVNAEAVKTDPYLYLRDGSFASGVDREQKVGQYGISYVVAVREMIGAGGTEYFDQQFLGYKHGGDAIVGNLNATYDKGPLSLSSNLFYMVHGTYDKWTVWTRANKEPGDNVSSPTSTHKYTKNHRDENAEDRDSVSKTLDLGFSASYSFDFGLKLFSQVDYVTIWNPGNLSSAKTTNDLQFTLSVGYEY